LRMFCIASHPDNSNSPTTITWFTRFRIFTLGPGNESRERESAGSRWNAKRYDERTGCNPT
jgi:hypothetical protein